jgi:hypothetical protein
VLKMAGQRLTACLRFDPIVTHPNCSPSATSHIRIPLDESLNYINEQSHKSSVTGFIGGMGNGRNRDS